LRIIFQSQSKQQEVVADVLDVLDPVPVHGIRSKSLRLVQEHRRNLFAVVCQVSGVATARSGLALSSSPTVFFSSTALSSALIRRRGEGPIMYN
jgi:hypothetical protein